MGFPDPIILLYHRIASPALDPWALRVSPEHFVEQMEVLRASALIVPLAYVRAVRVTTRPVVSITFDDGYADTLHTARPVLERLGLPATVFVMTAGLGSDHVPWWDDLERTFAGTDAPAYARARYLDAWLRLRDLADDVRETELDALLGAAGLRRHEDADGRLLRADEVAALAANGFIEIGAHTCSHGSLARLPEARQRSEIAGSRAQLEATIAAPVQSFAYPFGTPEHYSERSVDIVREAGFRMACVNVARPVNPGCSDFELPRFHVGDMGGERFERWFLEQCRARP